MKVYEESNMNCSLLKNCMEMLYEIIKVITGVNLSVIFLVIMVYDALHYEPIRLRTNVKYRISPYEKTHNVFPMKIGKIEYWIRRYDTS